MNDFDYRLKTQEIGRITKKTELRQLISHYMSRADRHYKAVYDVDAYDRNGFEKASISLQYLNLGKIAVARWDELGFLRKSLPSYTKRTSFTVSINVPIEHAVKLLGSKDNV